MLEYAFTIIFYLMVLVLYKYSWYVSGLAFMRAVNPCTRTHSAAMHYTILKVGALKMPAP